MKIIRALSWLLALTPPAAAFVWASLAARLPEPLEQRRAVGEFAPRFDLDGALAVDGEPVHVLARLAHLGQLEVPGMTIAFTAFANALLAVLLALVLTRLVRRAIPASGVGSAAVFFVAALLACSPAFGADWLHGERLGRFAVPLLFVAALTLLAPGRSLPLRAPIALVFAAAAAVCDARGAFVFLALVPALLAPLRPLWLIALLVVGGGAAVASFWPVGRVALGPEGVSAALLAAPGGALDELLRTTGSLWPDLLPGRTLDDRVLGWVGWLLPLLLLWRPTSAPAPAESDVAAAPAPRGDGVWWSCVAFGLLSVVFHHERHGFSFGVGHALSAQVRDELLYGGFLLPVGVAGLLAARLGAAAWSVAGGVLFALSVQGWERGLDTLRVARAEVERTEAALLLPAAMAGPGGGAAPVADPELRNLQARGWVPDFELEWASILTAAVEAEPDAAAVTTADGDALQLHGKVGLGLLGGQVGLVVVVAVTGQAPARAVAGTVLGAAEPGRGYVDWSAAVGAAVPDDARLMALGVDVRGRTAVRLGPAFVRRGGTLVEAGP